MDDVALANYMAGFDRGPVEAGRVDGLCARLLGVERGTVIWLSEYTLIKLEATHGEMNFSHYLHMPSVLLNGFLAKGRHANLLEFWWLNQDGGFQTVLKATRKREVFVKTFHPIHLREARRLYRLARKQDRLIRVQRGTERILKIEIEGSVRRGLPVPS